MRLSYRVPASKIATTDNRNRGMGPVMAISVINAQLGAHAVYLSTADVTNQVCWARGAVFFVCLRAGFADAIAGFNDEEAFATGVLGARCRKIVLVG